MFLFRTRESHTTPHGRVSKRNSCVKAIEGILNIMWRRARSDSRFPETLDRVIECRLRENKPWIPEENLLTLPTVEMYMMLTVWKCGTRLEAAGFRLNLWSSVALKFRDLKRRHVAITVDTKILIPFLMSKNRRSMASTLLIQVFCILIENKTCKRLAFARNNRSADASNDTHVL